jgi:hypothetical protein
MLWQKAGAYRALAPAPEIWGNRQRGTGARSVKEVGEGGELLEGVRRGRRREEDEGVGSAQTNEV